MLVLGCSPPLLLQRNQSARYVYSHIWAVSMLCPTWLTEFSIEPLAGESQRTAEPRWCICCLNWKKQFSRPSPLSQVAALSSAPLYCWFIPECVLSDSVAFSYSLWSQSCDTAVLLCASPFSHKAQLLFSELPNGQEAFFCVKLIPDFRIGVQSHVRWTF